MSVAVTVTDHWAAGSRIHVVGTMVVTGNYTTSGDACSFADQAIKSSSPPIYVEVHGLSDNLYAFTPGNAKNNGKLKVVAAAGGVEITGAAPYPADALGDTIRFHAIFRKFS